MQSEVLNVINDLKLDMTASPVDDVTIITRAQLKAIEAALSAAEPVAWQPLYKKEVINHMRTVSNNVWEYAMTVYPTKEQAEEYGHGGHEVRALYDRPQQPAPSVAVKALGWRQFTGRENDIEAITPCGRYAIRPSITANRFRLYVPDEKEVGLYETLQEAKAAAQSDYETRIRSALSAQVQDVATHRHKKRGSEYALIGVGKMQVENWCEFTTEVNHTKGREYAFAGKAVDMREVAIYRSVDDGSLWVRPVEEFNDGRFEPLPAAPAKQEGGHD